MKRYTHVFFDLDNTLWDFEKNSELAMANTFNQFVVRESSVTFKDFFSCYSKHNHSLWGKYRQNELGKKELIKRRFQDTFVELGVVGVDPEKMNAIYLQEMPKQSKLFPGVLDTLSYLKNKRYQLHIITNGFREVQHKKIETSGLMPFFGKIFTSEEIKCPKPNREIFEYAVKSTNAKKVNSIMVGDDWDVDIIGATTFGLDAIHFEEQSNCNKNSKEHISIKNTTVFKIKSINKIEDLL